MRGAALELVALTKRFGATVAVDQVSLKIAAGTYCCLLGPSGCGKTSTLRMIAGHEAVSSGDVILNNSNISDMPPAKRGTAMMFQSYALFPHLTARGNVEFGLKRHGASDIAKRVEEAIKLVGLLGKEIRKPAQLSGGERQRVALARSLVLAPDVLLLDEPLAALDPKLRKQMRIELKAMQRRVGITFLLVTHDQEEALSMSDQLAVMNEGRVEQVGTPEDIYLRPRTKFVAGFLGAVNWIEGIGIRPESTRIGREAENHGAKSFPALVTDSVFLGDCFQVIVRMASGEEAVAQVHRSSPVPQKGESVHISWNPSDEISVA
jgi:ABC-type Fe3+/spermidine/putrescine transport system ATPase subunit